MPSSADVVIAFDRFSRWKVIAKRCASSRTRCSRYSPSDVRGRIVGYCSPGSHTSSSRLASPTSAMSSMPELVEHRLGRRDLGRAAVDHDEVGRVGELLRPAGRRIDAGRLVAVRLGGRIGVGVGAVVDLLVEVAGEPAADHLGDPVRVARPLPHREAAVLALAGQPVLEHDHRRHHVRALHVADVEALDAQRRGRQLEGLLQLAQRARPGGEVGGALELVLVERLRGVARHRLGQRALVAALRHADADPRAAPLAEPLASARRCRRAAPARAPRAGSPTRRRSGR